MLPSLLPIGDSEGCAVQSTAAPPQHRLCFFPEPQGHGSFRPCILRVAYLAATVSCNVSNKGSMPTQGSDPVFLSRFF